MPLSWHDTSSLELMLKTNEYAGAEQDTSRHGSERLWEDDLTSITIIQLAINEGALI